MALAVARPHFTGFFHEPSAQLREPDAVDELPVSPAAVPLATRQEDESGSEPRTAKAKARAPAGKKRGGATAKASKSQEEGGLQAPLIVVGDERPTPLFDAPEQGLPQAEQRVSSEGAPSADGTARPPNQEEREIIISSWQQLNEKVPEEGQQEVQQEKQNETVAKQGKKGFLARTFGKDTSHSKGEQEDVSGDKKSQATTNINIPQTFNEMALMNARLIGAKEAWVSIIIDSFEMLMTSIVEQDERLLEQRCAVIAFRMHKAAVGYVNLEEFKVCLMASLRALLRKRWDESHECAWLCFWFYIEAHLTPTLPLPGKYQAATCKLVGTLDQQQKDAIGLCVFSRMFKALPAAERLFNQSNARLSFIVRSAIDRSVAIFEDPTVVEQELISLGLRHIMYKVPPAFFATFVECCSEELAERFDDPLAIEGFTWSLSVVASVMVWAIEKGSTPIVVAALANDVKGLKKALGAVPRAQRAQAACHIPV